jgi:AcrR family transcriptional regulator
MAKRSYVSPVRDAAAQEKRANMVDAATRLLRAPNAVATFSLDAVAKEAGVTRLTVYNQFGSRRGVFEEVFDRIAERGGLHRIPRAMQTADPVAALHELVGIFCDFWASDAAIRHLHDAMAIDADFARSLDARNERRRENIGDLVRRATPALSDADRQGTIDLIFALTSQSLFRTLSASHSPNKVQALIQDACSDALARLREEA